jgi:uncharacterized protein
MAEKSIPDMPSMPRRGLFSSLAAEHANAHTPSTAETPVWVLENARPDQCGPALALARRFGHSFRRIRQAIHLASAEDEARANGQRPALVVSSGLGAAVRALRLRARYGCRVIHCTRHGGRLPAAAFGYPFDILVVPLEGLYSARVIGTLGPMTSVSSALLGRARALWSERLAHLPGPRIAVLFGGGRALSARDIQSRTRQIVAMVRERGGAILACVLPDTDPEAARLFAASLGECMHLLWRYGEPDENPMLGFIGCSDAVVTIGTSTTTLLEASAADMPVFIADSPRLPPDSNPIVRRLLAGDFVRPLHDGFSPWPRNPLDEAGRVSEEIRRLMPL